MNPSDGSIDGWSWSMQGRVTNTEAITQQINYASVNRGLSYETEGTNRNVPVNLATVAERDAAAGPMANVFDTRSSGRWTFATEASTVLATTAVVSLEKPNGVRFAAGPPSRLGTTQPTGTRRPSASTSARPTRFLRRCSTGCCGPA